MTIGIIGAGAFGTSLAVSLANDGRDVVLWGRDAHQMAKMQSTRKNEKYLPDIMLCDQIKITSDMADLVGVDALLIVTPVQQLRTVLTRIPPIIHDTPVVLCSKGIEENNAILQSDILKQALPQAPIAVLSGPGFAFDLAYGKPTALTIACADLQKGRALQHLLSTKTLRLYLSHDIRGVQLGGALKNVFAIACGMVVGSNLGESARAAIITRGFSELNRLAQAMGGQAETLSGLSGFGDLTLSCTSMQSRNFSFGYQVAQSGDFFPMNTVEGIATARATVHLAQKYGIEMPIATLVVAVLERSTTLKEALHTVMARPLCLET